MLIFIEYYMMFHYYLVYERRNTFNKLLNEREEAFHFVAISYYDWMGVWAYKSDRMECE